MSTNKSLTEKKLEEIEKTLNDDTDESQDMSYLSELEEVLNKLE